MKNFVKILLVILVVLFLFAAVIGFLEMPIAEEGEELSLVQQWIVKLKTYLSTILTALGLSLDAVLLWLFLTINKLSANTNASASTTSTEVESIKENQAVLQKNIVAVDNNIQAFSNKQDILMELFSDTLLRSDLPASVREMVQNKKIDYDNLKMQVITTISGKITKTNEAATEEQKEQFAEKVGEIKGAVDKISEVGKIIKNTVSRF